MISIKKYNSNLRNIWDDFVCNSNNGTVFHNQNFINYHIDRVFEDHSLIIFNKNIVVGLLPAVVQTINNKKTLFSHPGISYGGLVLDGGVSFTTLSEIIQSVDSYCIASGFNSIVLINTPMIYFKKTDESINYLLQWNKYYIDELYISHAVDLTLNNNIYKLLTKRKQRYINNSSDLNQFDITVSNNFDQFYDILVKNKKKYKSEPTHSLDELIKLKKLFPVEFVLLVSTYQKKVVGGSLLLFANNKVSLVFYNVVLDSFRSSQLSMYQLYKCMELSKKRGALVVDFGVSHTPEQNNPLAPKFSLIQFKEQLGALGVVRTIFKKDFNVDK